MTDILPTITWSKSGIKAMAQWWADHLIHQKHIDQLKEQLRTNQIDIKTYAWVAPSLIKRKRVNTEEKRNQFRKELEKRIPHMEAKRTLWNLPYLALHNGDDIIIEALEAAGLRENHNQIRSGLETGLYADGRLLAYPNTAPQTRGEPIEHEETPSYPLIDEKEIDFSKATLFREERRISLHELKEGEEYTSFLGNNFFSNRKGTAGEIVRVDLSPFSERPISKNDALLNPQSFPEIEAVFPTEESFEKTISNLKKDGCIITQGEGSSDIRYLTAPFLAFEVSSPVSLWNRNSNLIFYTVAEKGDFLKSPYTPNRPYNLKVDRLTPAQRKERKWIPTNG